MSHKKFTTYYRGHRIVFSRQLFLKRRADVDIYEPGGRLVHQGVVVVGKTEEDFIRNVAKELKMIRGRIDHRITVGWDLDHAEERDQEVKWYH